MTTHLHASRASLHRLHKQSRDTQRQIHQLRENIQALENTKQNIDIDFEASLVQYAQAVSIQFASLMFAKLPTELRDMVYSYLYLEDATIPIGSYHFTSFVDTDPRIAESTAQRRRRELGFAEVIIMPEGAIKEDHAIERQTNILFPDDRTLDPAYLGSNVAYEANKFYYASNCFSICTLENAVSDFLLSDPAKNFANYSPAREPLGLRPVDHVRNLQVRIKCEHYDENLDYYKHNPKKEVEFVDNISSDLKPLMDLTKAESGQQMIVEFLLMTAFIQYGSEDNYIPPSPSEIQRRLVNIFEAARRSFYTLKYDLNATIKFVHHDETWFTFPKAITRLFALTREQWEYEKRVRTVDGILHYSPLHYFIAAPRTKQRLGYPCEHANAIMEQRWGFANLATYPERKDCESPIREGPYWPEGGRILIKKSLIESESDTSSC